MLKINKIFIKNKYVYINKINITYKQEHNIDDM